MKSTTLKRTGWILMLAGLVGVGITAVGMIATYKAETSYSATGLAEGINSSMLPASIGAPLVLAGLILALLGWWRGRGAKRLPV